MAVQSKEWWRLGNLLKWTWLGDNPVKNGPQTGGWGKAMFLYFPNMNYTAAAFSVC